MGQTMTTARWYMYGRKHFTSTGYEKAKAKYAQPDLLESVKLDGLVYMVTGANSGIGFELVKFLAKKQATVYMVCRNEKRGEAARTAVRELAPENDKIHLLVGDCSLAKDVRRVMTEFGERETTLRGLVCNAGALLNEKVMTAENVETTFACHLQNGVYLLGKLAMPFLEKTSDSVLLMVTSGGALTTKWPGMLVASGGKTKYNGALAYSWAKRGQILLAERWAAEYPGTTVVSGHPGWVETPGVNASFSSTAKFALRPLRDMWQGTEGLAWLCVAPRSSLESGTFYLDRSPQKKELTSDTSTSSEAVDLMMAGLEETFKVATSEDSSKL